MHSDLVVIGLGYVGLPLALEACRSGLTVTGLDRDAATVAALGDGRSHIDDIDDAAVAGMVAAGFTATTDERVIGGAATVVVCVPTPLSEHGGPELAMVEDACAAIGRNLRPGTLVVLESTTYPGTTEEVVRPILERSGLTAGTDFHLAFSPERVDPGNKHYGIRNTPKIVGGYTPDCTAAAAAFYGKFVDNVVQAAGTREAEMAKLIENTYRHVNIALVNEMAVFCHELGIDLWDAISCAATKPFGFQAFRPGPGVGGHCIPIDPNYLAHKVRTLGYPFRMVELAQEINTRMPRYVVERAQHLLDRAGRTLGGAGVLLLGVTYKADIADQRETSARHVVRRLRTLGADVSYHDPYVPAWEVDGIPVPAVTESLPEALERADLTILLQQHRAYDIGLVVSHARLLLDTRGGARPQAHVERL
ncbi:nucleotide sugar dehydrogenase [Streptantibioticus cattleyicolor]|uniref:Nucleotide sugar dehydrogenase n=1 Tax=Streptantibioticus cattleyicolor (strain ATCC 35852 / DSM 46488 / JCM 4925 / NBRC 14057 / NRRL 8057) TaxID=1003195 RepID=G8XF02_STREN|nr:nucleotide sugar dehydrogenase [Streptantibioticus cattleyicolor]AEW98453.1 nucleotide sugar dehydrogenase [Streptantibioticus cattleyicolor NRRL 8057 = DSM 46488]